MSRKVVLVTGAAKGLGNAIATTFHNKDYTVIAADKTIEENSLSSQSEAIRLIKLDVTSEHDLMNCANFVKEKYGRLDILISNAGIFDFYPLSEAGTKKLSKIMDVNLFGLANLTKYFLPLLVSSNGRLIVIGSESYKVPAPFQPYAVSKQALESLFNAIYIELALKGIQSILIRPGAIKTNILDETLHFQKNNLETLFSKEFDKFLNAVPTYVGRVSSTQKVAQFVYKAYTAKNPKRVYSINHNPLVTLLSLLPVGIKKYILKRSLS
jgi:NAD(P)-dependent dehydrogenase (short-subunit alcohol dehydrogenase family)